MSKSLEYLAFLAAFPSLFIPSNAAPSLAFPINSQLPPVAYASQAYEFTFLSTTFAFDDKSVSYTLRNNPSWLSINGSSRSLAGTPTSVDVGAPSFELVASVDTAYAVCSVTLVVLDKKTISVDNAALPQAIEVGSTSLPPQLLLHPQESFSFTFTSDAFDGISTNTHFYAVLSDRSPLPNWIQFDPPSMRFSGTTPPLLGNTPDKQAYSLTLAASNVVGFSEADIGFQIVIQKSVLAFIPSLIDVKVAREKDVRVPSLIEQLKVDGKPIIPGDVKSIDTDAPAWLLLDKTGISLSGKVPKDLQNSSFLVSVTDDNSNVANLTVLLQVTDDPAEVTADLGVFNATAGIYFEHSIQIPVGIEFQNASTAKLENAPQWLSIGPRNLTLSGRVPNTTAPYMLAVSINFDDTLGLTHGILTMNIASQVSTSTQATTVVVSGRATSKISEPTHIDTDFRPDMKPDQATVIAISVTIVTITIIVLLAGLAGWCVHRRRNRRSRSPEPEIMRSDPSTSLRPSQHITTIPPLTVVDPDSNENKQSLSAQPPRIELPWASDSIRGARKRLSKRRRTTHSSIIGPSWDDLIMLPVFSSDLKQTSNLPETDVPKDNCTRCLSPRLSGLVEREPIVNRPISRPSRISRVRVSKAPSTASNAVIGIPKRFSGAGHGAATYSLIQDGPYRSSWQMKMGDTSANNGRPGSVMLESFPVPPSRNVVVTDSTPARLPMSQDPPTLRLVRAASNDSDEFEIARQRFYTEKARARLEGSGQFEVSDGLQTPSRSELSQGLSRSPLQTLSESRDLPHGRQTSLSWSHWTNVGAAATNRASSIPRPLVRRDLSMTSSRQFDSAVSSDSQWEDEDLVADENMAGERHWQNAASEMGRKISPRLPFESRQPAHIEVLAGNDSVPGHSKLRLLEQRKHFDVEGVEFQRSQRSHRGSFRFV